MTLRELAGSPAAAAAFADEADERRPRPAEEENVRLREALARVQRLDAVGRLAVGVAHDFNNMLTAIGGYAKLLLDRLEPGDPLRHEAEQIRRAAEQAAALPRQLLAFSRRQPLEPTHVDVNEVVAETADLLRHVVGESIELVVSPSAARLVTFLARGQLEHVLVNLAANARDAMPAGGRLTISTRVVVVGSALAETNGAAPGPYVLVSAADTGVGMDRETSARVFEPFFTTKMDGSGLGLTTVHGLVAQTGGFVEVTSEPGKGARFDVYFPAATTAPARGPESEPALPTVLLAEDETIVREVATDALGRAGFRVLPAAGAAETLDLFDRHEDSIDVLVADLVMPGMSGHELAGRLVARRPGLPVVLTSGYADEHPVGVDGASRTRFLRKPFLPEALVEAVAEATRQEERPATAAADAGRDRAGPAHALTRREREVLGLLARGLTNEKVATELGISPETVQSHVRHAMVKLEADTRTQAVATALRRSLIP